MKKIKHSKINLQNKLKTSKKRLIKLEEHVNELNKVRRSEREKLETDIRELQDSLQDRFRTLTGIEFSDSEDTSSTLILGNSSRATKIVKTPSSISRSDHNDDDHQHVNTSDQIVVDLDSN